MIKKTKKQYLKEAQLNNSKYTNELRKKPTESEIMFRLFLKQIGLSHKFQKSFYLPFHRIIDFWIAPQFIKKIKKRDAGLAFEIDGGYHNEGKDSRKDSFFFKKRGLRVFRFKNEEIKNGSFITKFYEIAENNLKKKTFEKLKR